MREVEFKKQSLFERFGLKICSKTELMRQFQAQPELRKNLPLYIKVLNDEKLLFVEELFTSAMDGKPYFLGDYLEDLISAEGETQACQKHAALVDVVRNFSDATSEVKFNASIFDNLVNCALNAEAVPNFTFSKVDSGGEIYRAFLESLWVELVSATRSIVNGMSVMSANSLHCILSELSDTRLRERLLAAFFDTTATFIDTLVTRIDDDSLFEQGIEFVVGLREKVFEDRAVYTAYKHFAGKLIARAEEQGILINRHFAKIASHLKKEDTEEFCGCLMAVALNFLMIDRIDSYTYPQLATAANDAKKNLQYIDKSGLACEHKNLIKAFIGIATQSETWYEDYKSRVTAIKNKQHLSENLFEVCSKIYMIAPKDDERIIFFNMLSKASGFETELLLMVNRKETLENVVQRINENGKYVYYSKVKTELGDSVPTPQNIDQFILNFYALTILNPDSKNFFNGSKQFVYAILSLMENVPDLQFGSGLTPRGLFLKDLCMELPNDWEIAGTGNTVRYYLRTKLSLYNGSSYGDSISGSYVTRCDNVRSPQTPKPNYSNSTQSSNSNNSSSGGACYIATAIYGSYDCPQVWTLRRYRDSVLKKSRLGNGFVKLYYYLSPRFLKSKLFGIKMQKVAKWFLNRKVCRLNKHGFVDTPYND